MNLEQLAPWQQVIVEVVSTALRPFFAFNQHDSLLFWPFLLSTIGLALVAFWLARRPQAGRLLGDFRRAYFTRAVWAHPSAKADYRYYIANGILFPLLFAPIILSQGWIAERAGAGLTRLLGPGDFLDWDGVAVKLLYSLAFFVAYDFGRYVAHYLQHRFDWLWQFHKVHHSAEVLTPFTNYRAHPVDLVCMATVPALFTGLVLALFLWLFDGAIGVYSYYGLHIVVFAYNLIGNLRHSHVWLSYGPWLSRILISPAQHQIHHSIEPRHFGKNIGFALALWDGLFGTLYVPKGEERFAMGLGDGTEAGFHSVWGMYWQPCRQLLRRPAAAKEGNDT